MKKVFSKEMWKKFLVAMMIMVTAMWLAPEEVHAVTPAERISKIAEPIVDFVVGVGDGVVKLAHKTILDQDTTLLKIDNDSSFWQKAWKVIVAAVAVGIGIATFGVGTLALIALVGVVAADIVFGGSITGRTGNVAVDMTSYDKDLFGDVVVLPMYQLSPEEIFGGQIGLFNVNFFNTGVKDSKYSISDPEKSDKKDVNIAETLQPIIASWYVIIRNISLVAMLSILVYIGIRILISSTADNKAKYKQLLVDWLIGMCLLFFMHYGMAFGNMFVDKVTDLISNVNLGTEIDSSTTLNKEDLKSVSKNTFLQIVPVDAIKLTVQDKTDKQVIFKLDDDTEETITLDLITVNDGDKDIECVIWPTNLMGKMRMLVSYNRNSEDYLGYTILFLALVAFLVFFIWTYLKRVVYMAFLTLIAPAVALSYPLDKVKDGSAQGFQFWFKEYVYNLLLQPLHLLLYTVVVASAIQLATENPIYSMVALGFLVPAEGLVRQMFGFKGNTPGKVPGPAGAALMFSGINKLLGKSPKAPGEGKSSAGSSGSPSGTLGDNTANKYGALADILRRNGNQDAEQQNNVLTPDAGGDPGLLGAAAGISNGQVSNGGSNNRQYNGRFAIPQGEENTIRSDGSSVAGQSGNISLANANQQQGQGGNVSGAIANAPSRRATVGERFRAGRYTAGRNLGKLKDQGILTARSVGRNFKRNAIKGAKAMPKKMFKTSAKALGGAALGLAGGSIALAAGIASGDAKTALSGMATTGVLGYKAGENLVGSGLHNTNEFFGIEDSWNNAKDAMLTPEERKAKQAKEFVESEETQRVLDKLSKQQREAITKAPKIKERLKDKDGNDMMDENGNYIEVEKRGKSYLDLVAENGKFKNGGELVASALYGNENGLKADEAAKIHEIAKGRGYVKMNELGEERRKDALATLHRQVNDPNIEQQIVRKTDGLIALKKKYDL